MSLGEIERRYLLSALVARRMELDHLESRAFIDERNVDSADAEEKLRLLMVKVLPRICKSTTPERDYSESLLQVAELAKCEKGKDIRFLDACNNFYEAFLDAGGQRLPRKFKSVYASVLDEWIRCLKNG